MNKEVSAHTSLSHYRIVAKLGAGGMGEVWLAEDTRLDRQVALKLLPAEFTQDADRVRRFMQEAKAASALNHPNIITVYDIGESEAGRFIVMELVAGRTLRAIVAEDNSVETLLSLGGQMAKALSVAHAAGITHRDIKPDNIMVRPDGYVKILDFGLARLLPTTASDTQAPTVSGTTPGMLLGTVAYMSPEQARGEAASHPSDIFALGVVLYELSTGRHPFKADTLVGYLHAITLQTPPSLTSLKRELPAALDALILRMLEKDASQRPTASEVAQALQGMERHGAGHTPSLVTQTSEAARADEGFWVAVLSFKWRGANAELEALAEGLSEEIVTGLSRFSYLRVIARSSTLRYASDSGDVRSIGKELGARYVMEGSLRHAGSMLRVAVQLVDASTGAHLWAETYNRTFSPEAVFELQDDLVPRIVSTVADQYGALVHSMSESLRGRSAASYSAHEAVLRAFGFGERVTPEEHAEVREILETAVARAPGHSDCLAMLSLNYWHEYAHGYNVRPDPLGRAYAAAQRAVAAAPTNHLAHYVLATVLFFQKDFRAFRPEAERALALNRMDASTTAFLGLMTAYSGDWEYGLGVVERAIELNPHHPGWYHLPAFYSCYHRRDYRGALEIALKINMPGYFHTHVALAAVYGQLGEQQRARAALRELQALMPNFGAVAREEYGKWFNAELTEHLLDGLRKAGLKIAGEGLQEIERGSDRETEGGSESATSLISSSLPVSLTLRHTVGREGERHELRAAFNVAKDTRGSLLCVAGEPGIGKTTLVEDFLAELAAEEQITMARGRCSERLAGTEAYLPLLEALESLLHSDQSLAQMMKQLAPTWYAQVAPLSGESEEAVRLLAEVKAASQERMKRELANFLQSVAELQPLVIFFDDLHWADVSTIDLLSFLAGKFDTMRVLIVVTYRPSDMLLAKHPFLQIKPDLQARGLCRELLLEFLTEEEIAEYLALEFPRHRFPPEFPKLIHAKTEGSPLFMADLVRYLRDRHVIVNPNGWWALANTLPDIERELPESVRGMIERKIAQLGEEDRKLLTAASVQGYEFDSAVVAQVLKLETDEVEERLEKLERVFAFVKLVSESEFPNRTLTLKYRFVHVLYQNALYAALRATRKAALSAAVAQALEGLHGAQAVNAANELAVLWEAAREYAKAAESFRLAAQQASQVFASQEAVQLAQRGLAMVQLLQEGRERNERELALQVVLGNALMATRGYAAPEVSQTYLRARALCEQLGETPHLLPVLLGLYTAHITSGNFSEALELGKEFLNLAESKSDPACLVAHRMIGCTLFCLGELQQAREHFEQIISHYQPAQHRALTWIYGNDVGMIGHSWLAYTLWLLGHPDQALEQSQEAVRLAREVSHANSLAYALVMAAFTHKHRRESQPTFEFAEAAVGLATEQGFAMWLAWGTILRGWAMAERGEVTEGINELQRGLDTAHSTGAQVFRPHQFCQLAEAYQRAQQPRAGLAALEEAQALVEKNSERYWEAEVNRLRGELLLMHGAAMTEAESCFHQAIEIARRQEAKSLELRAAMSLARLWQQQGKIAEARQMLAGIYGWFTEGFNTADLKEAKALMDELQPQAKSLGPSLQAGGTESKTKLKLELHASSPSIAVLPFVNMSNDPDNEYFCDGLAEELLNALSKIEALHVAARTSAFFFKGKEADIREIGQKLNVTTVLEGSVRKAGNRLRITAQFVNVADGYHLWSEKYDRRMEDIFDIQDEISLAIVEALKIKLLGAEKAALVKRHTDNAEVYRLYLKGRFFVNQRTSESLQKAIEYFNQAIALDANYALGYAGLADAYLVLGVPDAITGALAPQDSLPKARAAAEKALQIDHSVGEIYAALAHVKWKERDWAGAESDYHRSIKLNPNYPIAHFYHAVYLASLGRQDEAVKEIRRAQEIDPLSLPINASVTYVLYLGRRYDAAIEAGQKSLELDAAFPLAHQRLGLAYLQKQMYREAIVEFEQAAKNSNRAPLSIMSLAHAYAVSGNKVEAQKLLAELKGLSQSRYVSPYGVAIIYVGLGDKEQAFGWLESAFDERNTELTFLQVDPRLDPLRSDPRFADLLRRTGLPQ